MSTVSSAPSPATTRLGAAALAAAGVLFAGYQLFRPYADETTMDGLKAMASNQWIAAHLFASLAYLLIPFGFYALRPLVGHTKVATAAVVTAWIGAGMTILYYGAEIFGVHEMAVRGVATDDITMLELVDGFRFHPAAITVFAAGLLLLGVSGILAAVAIVKSDAVASWTGWPLAVGMAALLPQFFTPPAGRMVHGVIFGLGGIAVAVAMWRKARKA
ncbi:hypothetical protein [Phytomonospora endophytica]|uniref:DUF4386 family protein n=1 Tax=Phytomonospora endophytica TaxID=714109 RepID=A0A841FIK6_9ACTN|nr:hypothetical protein [Phytomonospora endophytica]MBB6037171.1 hypothetical protein [Phytomonospora endophytica]GIG71211.1 hypothetical protein Pen01_75060 [Phytomonospora endophytica]